MRRFGSRRAQQQRRAYVLAYFFCKKNDLLSVFLTVCSSPVYPFVHAPVFLFIGPPALYDHNFLFEGEGGVGRRRDSQGGGEMERKRLGERGVAINFITDFLTCQGSKLFWFLKASSFFRKKCANLIVSAGSSIFDFFFPKKGRYNEEQNKKLC